MKRENWIDIMKGIAILAVLADHAFYVFYKFQNFYIWQQTFFAIPWFIFLSGITSTLSSGRKRWDVPGSFIPYWVKRLRSLIIPYLIVSLLIYLYNHFASFNFLEFLKDLANFSVQPTYYFVNLLFQLYLIFPILFTMVLIIRRKIWMIPAAIAIFLISFLLFTQNANLPWPFYSLGAVFGGKYLFLFFLGILYTKGYLKENKRAILLAGMIFLIYEFIINTSGVFFLRFIGINLIIWSIALFFMVKKGIEVFPKPKILVNTFGILGRYSLFIYLFHYFLLEQAAKYIFK